MTSDKGFDQKKPLYQICAWNCLKEENSWRDRENNLIKSIRTYLEEKQFQSVLNEEDEPDLIVLLPDKNERLLNNNDFRVFRHGWGNKTKKILYIHFTLGQRFCRDIFCPWTYQISRPDFSESSLDDWLLGNGKAYENRSVEKSSTAKENQNLVESCKLHLNYAVDANWSSENFETLLDNCAESISRSGWKLLKQELHEESTCHERYAGFFYGLLRLSGKFSKVEHDINREIKNSENFSDIDCLQLSRQETQKNAGGDEPIEVDCSLIKKNILEKRKKFVSACADLRLALHAIDMVPESDQNVVLLVDDSPEKMDLFQLKKIFETFLPSFQLLIWKPDTDIDDSKEYLTLHDLEHYQSLNLRPSKILEKKVKLQEIIPDPQFNSEENNLKNWTPGFSMSQPEFEGSDEVQIKKILKKTRFLLVDILFKDPMGREAEIGNAVIRGFHRLCIDYPNIAFQTSRSKWITPNIFAISRAETSAKVQSAFLSGASGYVTKSRLLMLPGILSQWRYEIAGQGGALHKNFRNLYKLPQETIGLMRATHIPPIRFDTCKYFKKKAEVLDKDKVKRAIIPIARLIKEIPKSDLHVHAGSCMTPEFLVVASYVMLLRHSFEKLRTAVPEIIKFWNGQSKWKCHKELASPNLFSFGNGPDAIKNYADEWKSLLEKQNKIADKDGSNYSIFRSILHKDLGIASHWDKDKRLNSIKNQKKMDLFLFGMSHSGPEGKVLWRNKDDLLRMYLLFMAVNTKGLDDNDFWGFENCHTLFKIGSDWTGESNWNNNRETFYRGKNSPGSLSTDEFKKNGWSGNLKDSLKFGINLKRKQIKNFDFLDEYLNDQWNLKQGSTDFFVPFEEDPIGFSMSTGTRSDTLEEYLEGCEFPGAEHLKHPFLIHLFAQQTVFEFSRQGVLYAELRAAVSGFENTDEEFYFKDVCECFSTAFSEAQEKLLELCGEKSSDVIWFWKQPFSFEAHSNEERTMKCPVKVNIVLTGKRHKPPSEMLRESSAVVILADQISRSTRTASQFFNHEFSKSRFVGFDLAGPEEGYPPSSFKDEYERIAKMNVRVTTHAGENAPNEYVESAVHDLRARRLGHGLSLIENKKLVNRVRENDICIELCPVSNFQTNPFKPPETEEEKTFSREYPLREYLKNGNIVCINTDNPVISNTNMIKECFHASYAYGGKGLSIWDLLRIIRMGFTQAFLHLPERRAILELADQIIFDLFSRKDVVNLLRVQLEKNKIMIFPDQKPQEPGQK